MAKELQATSTTATVLYAQVINSVGLIWNTAGTPAFEAYATANIADYDIAMTEQGTASGIFMGTMPAVVAGTYTIIVRTRAGGGPAETDTVVRIVNLGWSGTVVVTQSQLADAVAHGGTLGSSTATLALKNINVTSTTSTSAVKIENNASAA